MPDDEGWYILQSDIFAMDKEQLLRPTERAQLELLSRIWTCTRCPEGRVLSVKRGRRGPVDEWSTIQFTDVPVISPRIARFFAGAAAEQVQILSVAIDETLSDRVALNILRAVDGMATFHDPQNQIAPNIFRAITSTTIVNRLLQERLVEINPSGMEIRPYRFAEHWPS